MTDIISSEQLANLRLRLTSSNEVPVRDLRMQAEEVWRLIHTIEILANQIKHVDHKTGDQLNELVCVLQTRQMRSDNNGSGGDQNAC